jgi:hypothetical protein
MTMMTMVVPMLLKIEFNYEMLTTMMMHMQAMMMAMKMTMTMMMTMITFSRRSIVAVIDQTAVIN